MTPCVAGILESGRVANEVPGESLLFARQGGCMNTIDRFRKPVWRMRLAWIAILGLCALTVNSPARAGMYPVEPGEIPTLKADEGFLLIALDTEFPVETSFMHEKGALLTSRVLENAKAGHTLRLLRVPAGRYGWHSLRIGDWAHHDGWATFNISGNEELYFDVRPGVINYGGDLIVRSKDRSRALFHLANHGLPAIDWLDSTFPELAKRFAFVYSGHYADPFPEFYREARKQAGPRSEPFSKLVPPPDAGSLSLSPRVLWQQNHVTSIVLNNAGDLLALQLKTEGKNSWAIEIVDLKTSESQRVARTDIPFETLEWSGDHTLLLSIEADKLRQNVLNQKDADEFVSIVHVDVTASGKRRFEGWSIPRRGRVLDVLPEDPDHILFATLGVTGNLHVHKLDVSSKKALNAFRPETEEPLNREGKGEYWWLADGFGHLSVALSQQENERVLSRPEGKRLVEFLRLGSGSGFFPVSVSHDGTLLYAISDDDRDQRDLVEFDIATRKITRTLFSKPGVDVAAPVFDSHHNPIGVRYFEDGRPVSEYFEAHDRQRLNLLRKAFPGRSVIIVDRSIDDKQLILSVESSDSTVKFYHLDTVKGHASLIEDSAPWIDSKKLAPSEILNLKSKDGLPIEAYLTLPEGKGKRPLVVMPHGGPVGVSDRLRFDRDTQFLASLGYAVLRVNYRGSSGYGKSFREAGYGNFGTAIEDDIDAALNKALAEYPLDANRMCVLGFSYGGYSAMIAAVRWPDRFRCAISGAGVADRLLQFTASDSAQTAEQRKGMEKIMGDPRTQQPEMMKTSPLYRYREIHIPLMLVHGLEDQRVDYEQTRRMQRMLDLDGRPPVGLVFEGEGHGFESLDNIDKLWTGIAGFLKAHLTESEGAPGGVSTSAP
jgi:dipeptidyl aminopeptidase/acylaminoacyl peptidase